MAFAIKSTLQTIESYLKASGYFQKTMVGEPKSPPDGKLSAAVYMSRVGVAELTLGTTIESHVVMIRLYKNMLAEKGEDIEFQMAEVVQKVGSDLLGDYDLGGTVRTVDAAGQYGTAFGAEWGYVDLGGVMFRVADITVPLTVDDSATLSA